MFDHEDDESFRLAVRGWIAQNAPKDWRRRVAKASEEEFLTFQKWWIREKDKAGLATPHWPKEYGGAGLGLRRQIIISDEMVRADAPMTSVFSVSLNHIPATLIAYGTEEQKRTYLPMIPKGTIWCQGFSEPNAGSDLASLRTRAVRDGDDYVVNGQKIWSSFSMYAEYCILLTRTNPEAARKHDGITFLLVDMKTPGFEVRPITQSTGRAEFAELFFDNVRIPAANRVGEENQGWTVAQATLAAERGVLFFEDIEVLHRRLERYYAAACATGVAWLADDQLRREFMTLFAEVQSCRRLVRQLLREAEHEQPRTWMMPSYVKFVYSTLKQRIGEFRVRTGGLSALADDALPGFLEDTEGSPMVDYLGSFGLTIAGGTNEIQRNLIAERGLNLPKG